MSPSNESDPKATDQSPEESTFATRRAEQTARSQQARPDLRPDPRPASKVGGAVTDPDSDLDGSERANRPAWPGPTAASSVGQAAPERDRTSWAGPTGSGSSESDQTSRAIPTTTSSIGADTPVGAATPGPASTRTSEDEIYRPGERIDPSVREDYAHADADRKLGTPVRSEGATARIKDAAASTDDEAARGDRTGIETKDAVVRTDDTAAGTRDTRFETKDAVETGDAVAAKDVVEDRDEEKADADRTAPAPVTSISSGRRRSEAVPDAVAGNTDLTSDSEWRELQAQFVDDPEATVSEAATLIERDLAGLRAKLAGGSTEDLRNAFKRYRGLHESLR